MRTVLFPLALAAALAVSVAPASANVKAGVDAWQQGDHQRAIALWRPLAEAGDADAQFNMGQAYKMGLGVPADVPKALSWFRKAADQGHLRAEDNLGLLLFQQGQREAAIPYIKSSADRGEPRAQYLLGTALFNGEFVNRDWVRAYALMTRSAASGLQQAQQSLQQMDQFIPAEQRRQGQLLATQMERDAKGPTRTASIPPTALPSTSSSAPTAKPSSRPPASAATVRPVSGPVRTTSVPPSSAVLPSLPPKPAPVVAAAKPAIAAAKPAPQVAAPLPVAKPAPVPSAPRAASTGASTGPWRVQLGAFSDDGRAKALWQNLVSRVAALSGAQPFLVKGGGVTRLQAGGYASDTAAARVCTAVKAAGTDCLVKRN